MSQTVPRTAEEIARICHEANRAYNLVLADPTIPPMPPWDECDQAFRDGVTRGVVNIVTGKVSSPADSHMEWLLDKQKGGWVYGATKDTELRQHPCMVPYHQLPPQQRMKDHLFFAITRTLRSMV